MTLGPVTQEHHSAALPDHHPGEEILQGADVPGGPEDRPGCSQSQVGDLLVRTRASLPRVFQLPPLVCFCSMTELEKDINNLRSGLRSVESVSHVDPRDVRSRAMLRLSPPRCILASPLSPLPTQELDYQKKRPQELGDKFVSVVSQFITVASFSFSDVEDSLAEAKDLVRGPPLLRSGTAPLSLADTNSESRFLSAAVSTRSPDPIGHLSRKDHSRSEVLQLPAPEPPMLY